MSDAAEQEWSRALRCLDSAALLARSGDPDSAASRAYYAVFHAVTAYFLARGIEFGKHAAVESAVHRDLVRNGLLPNSFGAAYSRLRELRLIGDYGSGDHVEGADAEDALRLAREVIGALERLGRGGSSP